MKIAFILSSKNIVPPKRTGGIENSVYFLIRELSKMKHNITLYAAPGSKIEGINVKNISPISTDSIKLEYANLKERITSFYDVSALSNFFKSGEWKKFDIIHYNNYLFYEILPFAEFVDIPIVVRINYPHNEIYPYIKNGLFKKNVYYLPVSNFIKTTMPELNYLEAVYPAIDFDDFTFSGGTGEYLLSIGRIAPQKGTHLAIEIAKKAGKKLVIAGGVSRTHYEYFNSEIKQHIDNKDITYVGEVDFKTKIKIYKNAIATLFPIRWDEPFGIVPVESMACGTPVIAFDRAAVREIIKDGVGGYVIPDGDISAMANSVDLAVGLDRGKVRSHAENNFSISGQARKYEIICRSLIDR